MRHGQTLFNAQQKIQGSCDSPLTELGIQQAIIASSHMKELGVTFDEAYSSTSERAFDTLEIMTDIPYKMKKELKEWHFGRLEGEGEHLNPQLPYGNFFVQYGGEGEKEFQTRIKNAILNVAENAQGNKILIVAHGAVMGQFYLVWEHLNKVSRQKRIPNCSIFEYTYENKTFTLENIIEHDFESILNL